MSGEMAAWADHRDRRTKKISKEDLDEFWDKLLEKADYNDKEEINFFYHCTSVKGKALILGDKVVKGNTTDLPARAPLGSNDDVMGVWLAISSHQLPRRSPYGTRRMTFRVTDIITYMEKEIQRNKRGDPRKVNEQQEEHSEPVDSNTVTGGGNSDEYDHQTDSSESILPLLFFECAYFYATTQYVRLLLIRSSDHRAGWCRKHCKELDLHHNPFLQYKGGRVFTQRRGGTRRDIMVEVLLVGDIELEKLPKLPNWDKVGTLQRAGNDPKLGVC